MTPLPRARCPVCRADVAQLAEKGQVGGQVRGWLDRAAYGQHEAGWLAFYGFFRRAGIDAADKLDGLNRIAQSAGWWWPMRGAVILTERPRVLHRDEEGRLHCEDGPAIAYPDGFGVWAWHGVRMPRKVIEAPDELTAADITEEANLEVRRVQMHDGRWLPVDAHRSELRGNILVERGVDRVLGGYPLDRARDDGYALYVSHFSSCPGPAQRRRDRAADKAAQAEAHRAARAPFANLHRERDGQGVLFR